MAATEEPRVRWRYWPPQACRGWWVCGPGDRAAGSHFDLSRVTVCSHSVLAARVICNPLSDSRKVTRRRFAGVITVHLTGEDLLRTRFASHPAPLIELGIALASLHRQDLALARWRRAAATGFPREARPLLELIPASATGPLFLDPVSTSLAEGLDLVQQAPTRFVAAELERVSGTQRPPPWLRMLAERDTQSWRDLDRGLRLAYQHLLRDSWPRVWSGFRAELAWRGRLIAEYGIQAALSTIHPSVTWSGPVLQIATARKVEFRPGGAGLTLLPSVLWTGRAMVGASPDGSTVIVYPVLTPLPLIDEAVGDPVGELLGRTRAAVLRLTCRERTTTELASELGISAAAVSGHTRRLREAGLIVTTRAGKAVLHSLTPLGAMLLEGAPRQITAPRPARTWLWQRPG
jgi:DNA-binding transcriptional ArsR family regulator